MSTLYELTKAFEDADDILSNEEGLTEEVIEAIKDDILDDIKLKGDGVAKWLKSEESALELMTAERKRLQEAEKKRKAKIDRIKEYILNCMEQANLKKIDTSIGRLGWRKSEKVVLLNEDLIPDEYKTEEVKIKISKADIKKALKAGTEIQGATLEEGKSISLR